MNRILRWPYTRPALQLLLLAVAAAIVLHGLLGPQLAPRNLATVLTWVHYRGLLVVAILAVGNLFCTACPMILARDGARRFFHPALRWPRRLRGKWLALILFGAVLVAYELFDLWALPRATAWLVIGYFAAAVLVDVLFAGAAFCKYVCPVGQFNFMASVLAPTELRVADHATCQACRTADCIRGRRSAAGDRVVQRGCELAIFLPLKVGNLDCTMCLDCVRACPHDNIRLAPRVPGLELLDTRRRSGIGRLARRPDLAALAVIFTCAALLNALAMTDGGGSAVEWFMGVTGSQAEAPALALFFVTGLVLAPAALIAGVAALSRLLAGGDAMPLRDTAIRYAYALLPIGLAIWAAHYGFHFLTGALTIVPVTQSAAIDLFGRAALGEPLWQLAGMRPGAVFPVQLGLVLLGAAGSIALVQAIARREHAARGPLAAAPWSALVAAIAGAAMWVLAQPMAMRGVGFAG